MTDGDDRPRVAVIGCGRMGTERAARAFEAGADVRACVDVDFDRARTLAGGFAGANAMTDASMLEWAEIDAVFVCTPPSARESAVRIAARNAAAIMVEKPIGLSAFAARALAKDVTTAGIVNAVGYMNRYRASVRRAKDFVDDHGASIVMCHWASRPYGVPWWSIVEASGGPFNEQATHLVDLCRFVVGEIVSVEALAGRAADVRDGPPTRFAVALRFENGAVGTLCYTCDAPEKSIAFEVVSTAGGVKLAGWDFAAIDEIGDVAGIGAEPNVFGVETGAFLDAVRHHDPSLVACSFEDAARTQAVVDRVLAAAAI